MRLCMCHPLQLYRSMRAFAADTVYLAGEVLLQDRGLVLVPQVRQRVLWRVIL